MNGRVRRNPIEIQQLIRPHAQRRRDFEAELGIGARQQGPDACIQRQLPAERAQYQRGGQVAILGREGVDLARAQKIIAVRISGGNL